MKITLLNGETATGSGEFTEYLKNIAENLSEKHTVTNYNLASMDLKFCTGCWTCWWKTPGLCAIKDDAEIIFRSVINSDLVIFASPITAGFTSSELKKITDRLIVLVHPYTEIRNDEFHHKKRYDKYPEIAVLVEKNKDTDDQDLEIILDIYKRLALNLHSSVKFLKTTNDNSIEDICETIIKSN